MSLDWTDEAWRDRWSAWALRQREGRVPTGTVRLGSRGHLIVLTDSGVDNGEIDETWLYLDRMTSVGEDPDRPCGLCHRPNTADGHDGCIPDLPGAMNACCGHGDDAIAYVQFRDGRWIGDVEALAFMREQGRGPC